MLSNRNQLQNLNQENPVQTRNFPSKTPLRQTGPLKPGLTGGKGLGGGRQTTGRANRVLGDKDRNQGNSSTASLLFTAPAKASTSCTDSSPLPSHLLLLPSHLRTPSPGVHKYASFHLSPGVEEVEMEEEVQIQEDLGDRVVEGASKSSWDYDEIYEPPFELPNFKTTNYGGLLRAMPMTINDDPFDEDDAEERSQVRAEIPIGIKRIIIVDSDDTTAAFPLPRRISLSNKSNIISQRKPMVRSLTAPIIRRPTSAASSNGSTRTVVNTTTIPVKPKWGSQPISTVRKPFQSSLIASKPITNALPVVRSTLLSVSTNSRPLNSLKEEKVMLVGSKEEELELGIFGIVDEDGMDSIMDEQMAEDSFEGFEEI